MSKRRHNLTAPMIVVILIVTAFSGLKDVSAQATTLTFFPDPANIYLNASNNVVVDLLVTNGVMINAFDIILTYDSTIARMTNWVNGGYLDIAGGCMININNPGYFRLVCTQLNKPGANGNGILLKMTFIGISFGSTPITFMKAELSNKDAQSVPTTTVNGLINTLYQAGSIKNSSLLGTVALQGQIQRGGVPVTLERGIYVGQGPFVLSSTNSINSNLSQNPLPMDAYLITTNQPRYLNLSAASNKVKGILATPTKLSSLTLLGGDLNGDGQIGVLDFALVAGSFGQSGSSLAGDVNFDGTVNSRDLALVAGNFGQTSASAYAEWLP